MQLLTRNKKRRNDFLEEQKGKILLLLTLLLVMFTLGFKIQYVLFEIKSMIIQKAFVELQQEVRIIPKEEILKDEGMIIRDPQQSLFRAYVVEFNPETVLSEGDAVVRKGSLLGVVESVNNRFAVVTNISRSGYVIDGITEANEVIKLNGRGDGDFSALVPRDYEIEVGSVVRWVRNHNVMLGDVIDIKFDTRDVYKRVYIRSRIRNGILEKVMLLKDGNEF